MSNKKLKLWEVVGFSKFRNGLEILFRKEYLTEKEHTVVYTFDNGLEPMIHYSKIKNSIVELEWLEYPAIGEHPTYVSKESVDISVVKNAEAVEEGRGVEILENAFFPKEDKPAVIYDEKQDVLLIPGPKEITSSIDLGRGVYFLLSEGKVSGLLVKDARKKYEQAKPFKG